MSNKAVGWAFEQEGLSLQSRMVLFVIADSTDRFGRCWPKVSTIAQFAGLSERSVQRALADLEKIGLERQVRFDDKGRRTSDLFQLPPAACAAKSSGDTQSPLKASSGDQQSPPGVTTESPLIQGFEPPKEENQQRSAPLPANPQPIAKGNEGRKARSTPPPNPLPGDVPADVWAAFVALRREKRAPLTEYAVQLLVGKVHALAPASPQALLEQSIERGWTTVYPLKGDSRGASREDDDGAWRRNYL